MLQVIKRNGVVTDFDRNRILRAVTLAFDTCNVDKQINRLDDIVDDIEANIRTRFTDSSPNVEDIQDIVERMLVKQGLYEVSKHYILYRDRHRELRERQQRERYQQATGGRLTLRKRSGERVQLDYTRLERYLRRLAQGLPDVSIDLIIQELIKNIFDGISTTELERALVLASSAFIERDPDYDQLSARLVRQRLYRAVCGKVTDETLLETRYREAFVRGIHKGIQEKIFAEELANFDREKLAAALQPKRDTQFTFMGLRTLWSRYLIRDGENNFLETPQAFWMRVAMGLALRETEREERAIEFYGVLSTLRFVCSTPTLFHSGLQHPQLSSCYVSTVNDDLHHIFKVIADNAQLSKWSGGIGNDWTAIRATGAHIKSTNVESQGVIPFLKIANDTTVAINRSGKRRGATCAYLETWHLDIEDFLDLRRNTGDERRRTHDMNTANWIPDLFMKRVRAEENWTLFSPNEAPDLHELYGAAFEKRYLHYEREAQAGRLRQFKVVEAIKLWRKMLTRLFETGHPWITFKDPINIRSPQDHAGVVHNSNLCTEITLNTSADETAVCNLGSINLARHLTNEEVDSDLLAQTTRTAVRMLDNVIDINFYPTTEAERANLRHRPVGLGLMGFQDALFIRRLPIESESAREFADSIMETISYHAILASSKLAKERGSYESYPGSKWSRNLFPIDTVALLEQERDVTIPIMRNERLNWEPVRAHVAKHGMRNSNVMAIAPTATISNISGCYPCIEPIYKNIYVKTNMSGEFTIVNHYLVRDLKMLKLWNGAMLDRLKYYDGNIAFIAEIPDELKQLYKQVFDVEPLKLIALTAARAKWIDQSQSHNVFIKGQSGKQLERIYMSAWEMGIKTTYYLRSLGASQIEKATLDAGKFGFTQKRSYRASVEVNAASDTSAENSEHILNGASVTLDAHTRSSETEPQEKLKAEACAIDDDECEVCQ